MCVWEDVEDFSQLSVLPKCLLMLQAVLLYSSTKKNKYIYQGLSDVSTASIAARADQIVKRYLVQCEKKVGIAS